MKSAGLREALGGGGGIAGALGHDALHVHDLSHHQAKIIRRRDHRSHHALTFLLERHRPGEVLLPLRENARRHERAGEETLIATLAGEFQTLRGKLLGYVVFAVAGDVLRRVLPVAGAKRDRQPVIAGDGLLQPVPRFRELRTAQPEGLDGR